MFVEGRAKRNTAAFPLGAEAVEFDDTFFQKHFRQIEYVRRLLRGVMCEQCLGHRAQRPLGQHHIIVPRAQ